MNLSAANVPAIATSYSSVGNQLYVPSYFVCAMSLYISSIISDVSVMGSFPDNTLSSGSKFPSIKKGGY